MREAIPRDDTPRAAYLDALERRVLVYDGAMGTRLQALEPTTEQFGGAALEGWMDGLVLHSPDLIEGVHRSYLEVGADVIETARSSRPHRAWPNGGRGSGPVS